MSDVELDELLQGEGEGEVLSAGALLDVRVRVWAEIGRTRMPLEDAMGLLEGGVIDLDREYDEPVDLYVNGLHFAVGRLVTVQGEWALTIDGLTEAGARFERLSNAG
jgi:flagellar motor switch protein FliN/FliY